jgi:hypothetical protein
MNIQDPTGSPFVGLHPERRPGGSFHCSESLFLVDLDDFGEIATLSAQHSIYDMPT